MVAEKHIWISRPGKDGEQMATLAKQMGLVPWVMPAIDIMWLTPSKSSLRGMSQAEVAVVTSRHAITGLEKAGLALPAQVKKWFAIGQSTAKALAERGIEAVVPEQTDSEGMLQTLLAEISGGQTLLLLKGEGGRTLIANQLQTRGVDVVEVSLYRRICKPISLGMIETFLKQAYPILTAASAETLSCMFASVPTEQKAKLRHLPLVVMSDRVGHYAQDHGWQGHIIVADEASSLGLLQAAQQVPMP